MNAIGPENGKGATAIAPLLKKYLTSADNNENAPQDQVEIALRYAAAGMPVFPCDPATKRPLTPNGFHDATTDPAIIQAWWLQYLGAMIGCPTGAKSGIWVFDVDVDPTKGKDGEASLAALVNAHSPLPSTRIHRTPSGGRHYIFSMPVGQEVRCSANAIGPGLDVRGDGGYVIMPGSIREDGAEYTVVQDCAPVAAPEWLLNLTTSSRGQPSRPLPVDGKIEEGGRNDALTRQAGALRKVGMSAGHILDAIRIINATRCNPALDDEEVVGIVRSVARYEPQAPIWEGFSESDPSTLIPRPPVPPRFRLLTSRQVDDLPAVPDLVRGVLPAQGIAAMYGPSMSGKSFLLLDMLASVALGLDWFGHRVRRAVPVTYVALEGQGGIRRRKIALEGKYNTLPESFRFMLSGGFDIRNASDRASLIEAVQAVNGGGGIVCIDTLNNAAPGADENSSTDMGAMIGGAKTIQNALGGLVVLVHHTGKDPGKGLRGHSSLLAALDAAIVVERDGSDRRCWKIAKAKDDADDATHAFVLRPKIVGADEEGTVITSCCVDPHPDGTPAKTKPKGPQGGNQRIAFDCLREILKTSPHTGQGGAPANTPCVTMSSLHEALKGRLPCEPDRVWGRTKEVLTGLINRECVVMREDWLWLP
ncbi:bifunctional DNA primase/polymerase [Magnetospirillum sp. 15-1]|uniref:bifunctional DNA primase/polymerase n=1 Tax=Magnetospirillum sp. 15-1 TaxID=1979370 RepID=UPI0014836B45|nr:bifunctional DNA primase/polymerase [Magnetospirillum sp. 15-1]